MTSRATVAWVVLAVWLMLAAVSCAESPAASVVPRERAVQISTTACGHASATMGSGVLVGPDTVLTAAHVVIGAGSLEVIRDDQVVHARIISIDPTRDLALVSVPGMPVPEISLADATVAEPIVVVGGATSGSRPGSILRKLDLRVDDVRATTRSTRSGYELAVDLLPGDSGAGVYNSDDMLVGIVFSGPAARDGRAFVVDRHEIEAVLDAPAGDWACDPVQHRVEEKAKP